MEVFRLTTLETKYKQNRDKDKDTTEEFQDNATI